VGSSHHVYLSFQGEGCAAAEHYSSTVFSTARRYRLRGRLALIPPIKSTLRVPRAALGNYGKKHDEERGKRITADSPESSPLLEAGLDKGTEAPGLTLARRLDGKSRLRRVRLGEHPQEARGREKE